PISAHRVAREDTAPTLCGSSASPWGPSCSSSSSCTRSACAWFGLTRNPSGPANPRSRSDVSLRDPLGPDQGSHHSRYGHDQAQAREPRSDLPTVNVVADRPSDLVVDGLELAPGLRREGLPAAQGRD